MFYGARGVGVPIGSNGSRQRIVTLTVNSALDITTSVDAVRPTDKMRCGPVRYDPGGGGINVARIAHALGGSVLAIFTAGGAAGGRIGALLRTAGVPFREVPIADSTRESFTVNEAGTGQQYRFVLPGPQVTLAEQVQCLSELRMAARSGDYVVASGSLPPGVPGDYYQRVADVCDQVDAALILDTSGGGLRNVGSGVFLLKPSLRELREYVGRELITEADQVVAAQELLAGGRAQIVVVSLGQHGALMVTADGSQKFAAVPMRGGSGVGAGDAMLAAITIGLTREWPLEECVRLGIAAGAAMLLTPGTEICDPTVVHTLFDRVADPVEVTAASGVEL